MATAPVKSQPLHNFSLPFLKWGGKNHTNSNHRFRRPISAVDSSTSQLLAADHLSELETEPETRSNRVGSKTGRNRFGSSQKQKAQILERRNGYNETEDEVGGRKRENEEAEEEEEEEAQKPWKLRPRRSILTENGSFGSGTVCPVQQKSLRLRGFSENQSVERKGKRKFWIALSKDEIEEDIFVMTGSRPSRRPKKRPKNVQKQLDSVFPGLWLVGYTADVYKAADTTAKK